MGKENASESEVQTLMYLATAPNEAISTQNAKYDMMAHGLTKADVCDALLDWNRSGKPIVRTIMRGKDAGDPGFEIWPIFHDIEFYCKFIIREMPMGQKLLVVSVHPSR